ncbi:flagellar basal body-associated FliL family protein [Roseovarius aquimarinus]|uniref:Flagellar protein FliL n=1 Tax=Roseovarius aquimarinus TaxID=1229156 RepID=A0ABW7I5C4_9RHOB
MSDSSAPDVEGRRKGGAIKKILVWVLVAAILGGGGFGAGLYFAGGRLSPSEEVLRLLEKETAESIASGDGTPQRVARELPEEQQFETRYYEFPDPMTTNLRGTRQFLQVGVGVSTQYDETVIKHVETHAMALRSDMLAVISGFSEEEVQGTGGRDALAEAIKAAINTRLEALEGFGGIDGVFFPSFVMQ